MNESEKLQSLKTQTLYPYLKQQEQHFLLFLSSAFRLTFQEVNQVAVAARDLEMWEEPSVSEWFRTRWPELYALSHGDWETLPEPVKLQRVVQIRAVQSGKIGPKHKDELLNAFWNRFNQLKSSAKAYSNPRSLLSRPLPRLSIKTKMATTDKKIHGLCPVASPETICCQLRTIDAVECCAFSCSYCVIQTFYGRQVVFDKHFADKLAAIDLAPDRFYHFGSGQSSDSLFWGNKHRILAAQLAFARLHPNILLELKTKSINIGYLLRHPTPPNIVCSWSLNAGTIIRHEEHGTPALEARLKAARRVADRGIKVGFHFHPLIFYKNWQEDYKQVAQTVQALFQPREMLFISFGTLTLIKPAIQAIRKKGGKSKILQMPVAYDPKGKMTYPDEIKIALFKHLYEQFAPWHKDVFFYLCMEKSTIWQAVFNSVYSSNEEFEKDFGQQVMPKISPG
jgi:spore photoproduct lyase